MSDTVGAGPERLGRGIKVLEDRVLVRRDRAPDRTKGGILLPDRAQDQPDEGTVVAVGPGKAYPNPTYDAALDQEPFVRLPPAVAVGDKVVFLKYGGTTVRHEGEDLVALREADVIAVVESVAPVLPAGEEEEEAGDEGEEPVGAFPDPDAPCA